jgi:hypothetical protein
LLGPLSGWLSPVVGHALPYADYRITGYPQEPVQGQPTSLGYLQQDLAVGRPVWQDCANEWLATVHVRGEIFHTGAILPDTRQPFPSDLWNIRVGSSYRHLFDNGWIAGGSLNVGSASDKPFHSIDEMTLGASGFLRIPQGEHNAWLFTLSYSPTSELNIPIPGVAYFYAPSEWFQATIGIPFAMVNYRPTEDLSFQVSYMLVRTVHARATYRLAPRLRLYAAFDWGNESYFLAARPDERDRFFYYDTQVSAGVQWWLAKQVSLDLSGGYVFDRFYFEGHNYNDRNFNRVDVGDGPFASLRVGVHF